MICRKCEAESEKRFHGLCDPCRYPHRYKKKAKKMSPRQKKARERRRRRENDKLQIAYLLARDEEEADVVTDALRKIRLREAIERYQRGK